MKNDYYTSSAENTCVNCYRDIKDMTITSDKYKRSRVEWLKRVPYELMFIIMSNIPNVVCCNDCTYRDRCNKTECSIGHMDWWKEEVTIDINVCHDCIYSI
jgi:hypothetical protein